MPRLTPGSRFALAVSTIALAFALLGAGLAWRVYANERQHAVDETAQLAMTASLNADRFVADRLFTLTAIATAPPIRAGDIPAMLAYFESLDPAAIGFGGGVGWVDRDGLLHAYSGVDPALLPIDISQGEHVQTVLQGQAPYVGEAFIDGLSGEPVLPFAAPSFDAGGQFLGLVVGSVRLGLVEAAARERRFGTDDLYIIDRAGNIIFGPEHVSELVNVAADPLVAGITQGSAGARQDVRGIAGDDNQVVGYATVPSHNWTILVERSEDELWGDARRTFLLEVAGLAIVWLAVTAGAVSVGRRNNRVAARATNALAELEVREARLRSLTEATTQVIWTVDPSGALREPEKRWSTLTGIPVDQLDREAWLPYVHPDDRVPGDDQWQAGIAEGHMIEFEQRVTRGDGSERNFLVRAVPVREADGAIREWIGVDIDVTRQRQAERAIAESEERYRALVEATATVIWRTNADGAFTSGADAWERITGQASDEARPDGWSEVVHPDDHERVQQAWHTALQTRSPYAAEFRLRQRDGSYRYFAGRGVPVFNADGSLREWVGSSTDIHDRRRIEESLRETAERLSLALEAGQLDTWDWDIEADHIVWSETAKLTLGSTPPDIERFIESVHPDDRARVTEAIRRSLDERAPYEVEYRTVGADGVERWLYVRGEAFHDEAGRPLRMLGVDVDVTERKMRELFEQDFIANVAHDTSNPLAAVKAQTQLLRRRVASGRADVEAIDAALGVIDTGLTRMNRRIEELADVARLRAGRQLELKKNQVKLGALVWTLVESYQQTTDRHIITLDAPEPDLAGVVDEGRIERVIDNLISNAVKYSPDGGHIGIVLARDADAPDLVRLSVADHGIGIPASDLPHIFERYRRAGNTTVITGTGIGLAGGRQIVEQHGGRIEIESREGAGSIFTVVLPLMESAAGVGYGPGDDAEHLGRSLVSTNG